MKKIAIIVALCAGLGVSSQAQAIGCLSGAAVGAVGGHMAHHHAVIGAIGGCIIGHRMHKQELAKRAAMKANPPVTTTTPGAMTTTPATTPAPAQ